MRLSNIIKKDSESGGILEYETKKIDTKMTPEMRRFIKEQPEGSYNNFKVDKLVSEQRGLKEVENQKIEDEINKRVLEKLKDVQEKTYQEAYDLGMKEGEKRAFEAHQESIAIGLKELETLLTQVRDNKVELEKNNERNLIDLVYFCARKVVQGHIEEKDNSVLDVLKKTIEELDSKENIKVLLNEEDLTNIQTLMQGSSATMDALNKVKMEVGSNLSKGECLIETDHGLIDATLEARFESLWDSLNQSKPK